MPSSFGDFPIALKGTKSSPQENYSVIEEEFILCDGSSLKTVFELGEVDRQFAKGKHGNITELLIHFDHFSIHLDRFKTALVDTVKQFPIISGRRINDKIIGNKGVRYRAVKVEDKTLLSRTVPPSLFARPLPSDVEGAEGTEVFSVCLALGCKSRSENNNKRNTGLFGDTSGGSGGGSGGVVALTNDECSSSIGIMWDHSLCDVGGLSVLLQYLSFCYESYCASSLLPTCPMKLHFDRSIQAHLLASCNKTPNNKTPSSGLSRAEKNSKPLKSKTSVKSVEWVYTNHELEQLKLKWSAKTKHIALFCEIVQLLRKSCCPDLKTVSVSIDKSYKISHLLKKDSLHQKSEKTGSVRHFGNTTFIAVAKLLKSYNTTSSDRDIGDIDGFIMNTLTSALSDDSPCEVQLKEMADLHLTTWWHPLHPREISTATATATASRGTELTNEKQSKQPETSSIDPVASNMETYDGFCFVSKGYNALSFGCRKCPKFRIGPNTTASAARICLNTGKPNATILPSPDDDGLLVTMRISAESAPHLLMAIEHSNICNKITPKPLPQQTNNGNFQVDEKIEAMRNSMFSSESSFKLDMFTPHSKTMLPRSHTYYSWIGHGGLGEELNQNQAQNSIPPSHCSYSWKGSNGCFGEVSGGKKSKFVLIWLHGLGDDSEAWKGKFKPLLSSLQGTMAQHFPKAPMSTVSCDLSLLRQSSSSSSSTPSTNTTVKIEDRLPSWFDIHHLPLSLNEPPSKELIGLETSIADITSFIVDTCQSLDIDSSRVVIGGFSQGGALALEVARNWTLHRDKFSTVKDAETDVEKNKMKIFDFKPFAGVVSVSGWCLESSSNTETPDHTNDEIESRVMKDGSFDCKQTQNEDLHRYSKTPVLFTYGSKDPLISYDLSLTSSKQLGKSKEFHVESVQIERKTHMPKSEEMTQVASFIKLCYQNMLSLITSTNNTEENGSSVVKIVHTGMSDNAATSDAYSSNGTSRLKSDTPQQLSLSLPVHLQQENTTLQFDPSRYPLYQATCSLLQRLKVGHFEKESTLESFMIHRSMGNFKNRFDFYKLVSKDEVFLAQYDKFMLEVVLPHIKSTLPCFSHEHVKRSFHYQRPPTVRVQGFGEKGTPIHNDKEFGHQPGELNFWLPLTDLDQTKVTLWLESSPNKADFHPLEIRYGQVASFLGSLCRHYVPDNRIEDHTKVINTNDKMSAAQLSQQHVRGCTRISLDFRVGIVPYYDPNVELNAKAQHTRKEVLV